jgi:hypothetical protein
MSALVPKTPQKPNSNIVPLCCDVMGIKSLHTRCKRMETIIVSWQNGMRFSVKWKLSLHKRFPQNFPEMNIVSN